MKKNKFFLLKKIILISLLFQCYLEANEKLVVVGGIDFNKVSTCSKDTPCKDSGYLLSNSKKLENTVNELKKINPNITTYEFKWSGDPVSHQENYNKEDGDNGNLKKKFEDWFYNEVCIETAECKVSFISHSWGTIISSDFIASIPEDSKIEIKTIITYGSPITGVQIKDEAFSETVNFWENAVTRVNNMNGKWINIINTEDPFAWKIPNTINLQSNGSISTKGRLLETFPVNASEFDPIYLETSILRFRVMASTNTLAPYLAYIGASSEIHQASSIAEIVQKHLTESYEPQRFITYLLLNKRFSTEYFTNEFGVKNLGLATNTIIKENGAACQKFEQGILFQLGNKAVHNLLGSDVTCDTYKVDCFNDISSSNYEKEICILSHMGIFDNSKIQFNPSRNINRVEFLKVILSLSKNYQDNSCLSYYYSIGNTQPIPTRACIVKQKFTDIDYSSWYINYLQFAIYKEIINGYSDNTFRPTNNISFSEASKILVNTLNLILKNNKEYENKHRIPSDAWYYYYYKVLNSYNISLPSPEENVTREDMAYIIYQILKDETL